MDLKNVCRTCLRIPKKSVDLFDNRILEKIDFISLIKFEITESMPHQICEDCFKNVNYLFRFQKLLIHTDNDLRSRLETLQQSNNKCKPRSNDQLEKSLKIEPPEALTVLTNNAECFDKPIKKIKSKNRIYRASKKCVVKCDKCNKIFDDRSKFNKHRNVHNRVSLSGVCNICGAQLLLENLKRHMRIHSEQPYRCELCAKLLKNSSSMRSHMLRHSDKVIICEICGKEFNVQQNLQRHMKSHLDPSYRKKPCHLCGTVIVASGMKKHMRKHTGERPYVCTYCKKGLTSSYALKVHTRLHTNEKPFLCDYCTNSFPQRVSLRNHLKSAHGIVYSRK